MDLRGAGRKEATMKGVVVSMMLVSSAVLFLMTCPVSDAFSAWSSSSFVGTLRPVKSVATKTIGYQKVCLNRHGGGMQMMFDQLSEAISEVARKFGPKKRISEASIGPALKTVRRALLDADVNVAVADALIDGVRKRSLGKEVMKGVTAEQQFVKAMYDELLDIMGGGEEAMQELPGSSLAVGTVEDPAIILLAGLQGAGKTTVAGKLALYLKEREVNYEAVPEDQRGKVAPSSRLPKRQRSVLIIAADVYRPAAIEQLQVLGERVGVDVFALSPQMNPVEIVTDGIRYAKSKRMYDTIIVDTAGRQVIDSDLMGELRAIKAASNAAETLLVVDAMTGQEAATLTAAFDSAVGITGAVLTKMDGDVRGGAAVSVRGVSGKPIRFIGVGEKVADLEPFYPDRMASRILGMGDVVTLVEKAAAEVSDADAAKMQQKMMDATFDFDDFLKQSELVTKMGSMASIAKMMPGLGNQISTQQIRDVEIRLKKNKAMINSMTPKERSNPDLFISDRTARSRLLRITRGAGHSLDVGQQFISEFQRMRTMMSRMQKQMSAGAVAGDLQQQQQATMDSVAAGEPVGANRAIRRAAKKNKKGSAAGGRGFGLRT